MSAGSVQRKNETQHHPLLVLQYHDPWLGDISIHGPIDTDTDADTDTPGRKL